MSMAGRKPWGLTAQSEKGDAEIPSPEPRDTRTRVVMVPCLQGKITQEVRQVWTQDEDSSRESVVFELPEELQGQNDNSVSCEPGVMLNYTLYVYQFIFRESLPN